MPFFFFLFVIACFSEGVERSAYLYIKKERVFLDWCRSILWYCAVHTKRIHKVYPVISTEALCAISFIN